MVLHILRHGWRLIVATLVATQAFAQAPVGHTPVEHTPDSERYSHAYEFGADWFWPSAENWKRNLAEFKGKPNLNYLEIGPFEGRSFFWMMDNILTHPSTKATAIDVFETGTSAYYVGEFERRFRNNVKISGRAKDITVIKGYSQVELRPLPLDSFDLIYIDGSHAANDVMSDVILSWGLLKEGGVMIFDDYRWHEDWPPYLRPAFSINAFLSAFDKEVEVIPGPPGDNQLFIRKRANLCLKVHYEGCSYFGDYLYDWRDGGTLYRAADLKKVGLTSAEKRLVERILRTRDFGKAEFRIDAKLRKHKLFDLLNHRLGLGL